LVNKNVLSCLLKDGKEVNAVMLVGRLLKIRTSRTQVKNVARATVTRNDRSPMVLSRVRGTIRRGQEPDRNRRVDCHIRETQHAGRRGDRVRVRVRSNRPVDCHIRETQHAGRRGDRRFSVVRMESTTPAGPLSGTVSPAQSEHITIHCQSLSHVHTV